MQHALYGKPVQTDKIGDCLLSDVLVVYDICHCRCMTYPCSSGLRIELFASMVALRSNCVSPFGLRNVHGIDKCREISFQHCVLCLMPGQPRLHMHYKNRSQNIEGVIKSRFRGSCQPPALRSTPEQWKFSPPNLLHGCPNQQQDQKGQKVSRI